MRPLFFRILALLLVSFVAVLILAFFLFRLTSEGFESEQERLEGLALVTSGQLVDAHLAGDARPVMRRLRRHFHARAWVLDQNSQTLFGPPIPENVLARVSSYPAVIAAKKGSRRGRYTFANIIQRNQTSYRVIIDGPKRGFRHGPLFIPLSGRFLLMILSLGTASILLSYWILRPLNSFLRTTRNITGERLDARIPLEITARKDAFGNLGREFNQMTDRLSHSIDSQRQLLRDVSHELRSPLARIQVAASLLHQKLGDRTELSRIETEVERLDDLIESLLSLSRLQTGGEINAMTFDLSALLGEIVNDANFEFEQKQKRAVLEPGQGFSITADKELLSSALENIIRNGLRFTEADRPVSVAVSQQSAVSRDGICVVVADGGPGVNAGDLEHLFEPFYKADKSRHLSNGHHGIGLALARAIVKLHRGHISARNNPEGGLCVSLWLPDQR